MLIRSETGLSSETVPLGFSYGLKLYDAILILFGIVDRVFPPTGGTGS
jgi:hypothetical protein